MIKTGIVILNWNGIDFLRRFLPGLVALSDCPGAKVFLADNGSADNSVEWTRTELPMVEIIEMGSNLGFSGGYNVALSHVDAEYYVLINSDIEVTRGWLSPLIEHLDDNPGTAVCQPKILSEREREYFEYAGAAGGFIDRYGFPFCRGRVLNKIEKDTGQYNDNCNIFWASGACLIIRSSVWREMGGLDPDFFAHMEEIDLCWRILASGLDICCIPGSVVYHVGGGTLSYDSPRKTFLNFRNNLFLLHKNLPGKNYRRIIFVRMLLDGLAGIRFIMMMRFKNCWQIFRAHIDYYRNIKSLNIKRSHIQLSAKPLKSGLILNKSIVTGFYMEGKKLFSDYLF